MNKKYFFIVSLEEFFEKEKYTKERQKHFRKSCSRILALVIIGGKDYLSLPQYMNHTLKGLYFCKRHAHEDRSPKSILDYDYVCRAALDEWVPLLAAVLRNFALDTNISPGKEDRRGLSELVDGLKQIAEYFIDAQNMLLNSPTLHSSPDKSCLGKDNS
jgi:hypothetical protein